MASADRFLISAPHRVLWGGFETTTTRMQQAGWRISCQQDAWRDGARLALINDELRMSGITDSVSYYHLAQMNMSRPELRILPTDRREWFLTFHIIRMNHQMTVGHYDEDRTSWYAVDAMPQIDCRRVDRLEDFAIFAQAPMVRSNEIIVDPSDVNQLMEQIIKLQKPEQEALRQKARLRESREGYELEEKPVQRQTFHAQILSIAA
jgi:hypothetical protein